MNNRGQSQRPSLYRRPIFWLLIGYCGLLLASHLYRMSLPDPPPRTPTQHSIILPTTGDPQLSSDPVTIRYLDTKPASPDASPVVLFLHGSPMAASHVFPELIESLPASWRILAPDLPGFGTSTQKVPDYSIEAHADYLLQFMDRLDIEHAHLVAYSMGGGIAIHLAAEAPERVTSIALLSSIGVQELELLGDYHLNRALHGTQLALIWLLQEGIPHFGWFDRFPLNTNYARNFYETDQRPLRDLLREVEQPTLIWHGASDTLVPAVAAKEHYRLVPQSELRLVDGGHLLMFEQPDLVTAQVSEFVSSVEAGKGVTRAEATPDRVDAASELMPTVILTPAVGPLLIMYMTLIALATLVSEDLACIGAGMMAARGIIGFVPAAAAAFIGIVIGDILLFLAGRFIGRPALGKAPLKWFLTREDIERSSEWFRARGPAIILISRFLPGSRLPTYFTAGMLGTSLLTFTVYFAFAALLWTPALVGLSTVVGSRILSYYPVFEQYAIWVALATVFFLWLGVRILVPLSSFRGRRLLLSRFRRLTRWEFWPVQVFYIPVVGYILFLGLRHRNFTVFTAANPGMPAGGIIGESKSDILSHLKSSGSVASYILIEMKMTVEQQLERVRSFMERDNLDFPIILKPDVGQRGQGVTVARDMDHVRRYFEEAEEDTIVQEYIEGREYGVFYYRYPGKDQGAIFSITDKRRLFLTGDGKHTLEELILMDDRAVCLAPLHFRVHRHRLFDVPAAGEEIELVEVGTHARGALFLDGSSLITPEMTSAFDSISRKFNGFYFGRYDIRVPSVEDFQQGKTIKVLELNGVTSEATHVYDPDNRLFRGWRDLMCQWRIAFEIGAANAERGVRPISVRQFMEMVFFKRY